MDNTKSIKSNTSTKKASKNSPTPKKLPKRAAKEANKRENLKLEEKKKQKKPKRAFNREIEVMTSIKITKSDESKPKESPSKKSKGNQTPKNASKSNQKSPVTKAIVRKRHSVTPQKPKKVKRQKLDDSKIQIQIDKELEKSESHKEQVSHNLSEKEETKQQTAPSKTTTPQKTPQKEKKQETPVKPPKEEKEESKESVFEDKNSKVPTPLEIKKMIENSTHSSTSIFESIRFPTGKNSVKVLQHMREISIASVKRIQNTVQRIKASEKKLKHLEHKTNESLKKKGICIDFVFVEYVRNIYFLDA